MIEPQNLIIWGRPNSGKSYLSHLIAKCDNVDHSIMKGTILPKKDGTKYKISFLRRRIEDVFTGGNEKVLIFIRDPRISWICQITGMLYHTLEEYLDHAEGAICSERLELIKYYKEKKDSIYIRFEDTLNKPKETLDTLNSFLNTEIEYLERIERFNSLITKSDLEKMRTNRMNPELINKVFKHIEEIDKDFIKYFGYNEKLTFEESMDSSK